MKAKKLFLCILLLFLYACQGKEDTEKRTELQQKEEIIEEKSLQETEKVKKEEMTEEQNRKMSIKEAGIANKKRKMQNSKIEKKLKKFVPRGWRILQFVTGDLNKDKLEDVAMVIEKTDSRNFVKNNALGPEILNLNPRELWILFQEKDGDYALETKNDIGLIPPENTIECTALADPLVNGEIFIENHLLKCQFNYWLSAGSWYASIVSYIFRYQKEHFELIGVDYYSYHRASGEEEESSYNLSTGKMKITTGGNISGEGKEKVEWKNKPCEKKPILEDLMEDAYSELLFTEES